MKKKSHLWLTGDLCVCVLLICIFTGCIGTGMVKETNSTEISLGSSSITLIELYHFHGNQQCYSCKKLGEMAEEVVKTNYPKELASGKLIFDHVNVQDPTNADLVEQFEVSSSSLMMGVHTKDTFAKADIIQVWYCINDKEKFEIVLRDILDPLLLGEQS